MNTSKAANQEHKADPVLAHLDRVIQEAIEARSAYLTTRERLESGYKRASEQARGALSRSTFTAEQVAPRFGVETSTIRDGAGKHACLRLCAYKPGKRLLFPLQAIEAHERNLMATGECGVCDKQVSPLELVKRKQGKS
jgi:hypothetical protein